MDNGFGTNLEGFLIHGNLSLNPGEIPAINGDGSIEASGTFYIDTLREYNNKNGIDIQNVVFYDNHVEIPFTNPSDSSLGSLLLNGGISILNTTDSTSLSSGGTITTLGGVSIGKSLNVGGVVNVNNNKIINVPLPTEPLDAVNKEYVDARTIGFHYTTGQVLIGGPDSTLYGFPEFIYDNIDGLSIYNTRDAVNLTSGGSITTYGGVNIFKTLNVGDIINVNNNKIINVSLPTNSLDAANKEYVDSKTLGWNFTSGQVLIGGSDMSITGFSDFIYDNIYGLSIYNTTDATSLTSGGSITTYGGVNIYKKLNVGDIINVNNNKIINVSLPTDPLDAANKEYVDSKTLGWNFTTGQVLIGGYDQNLTGFPQFVYDNIYGLSIYNTTDATSLTAGGSITTYGGVNIFKTLNVGDIINVNNNKIINVSLPTEPLDATNKIYVDNLIESYIQNSGTIGSTNFSSGQILFGGHWSSLNGDNSFIFTKTNGIFVYNTTDATGLGTGGALTITGGLSVNKHVYIGYGLDMNLKNITNVATPIRGFDAVNKNYFNASLQNLPIDVYKPSQYNYEHLFILENNIISPPLHIPFLKLSRNFITSFITFIYVTVNNEDLSTLTCLYTIFSFYNGSKWIYNSRFTGFKTKVQFVVETDSEGNAIVKYTNTNMSGITSVKYYVEEDITRNPNTSQYTCTLNTTNNQYIDFLSFIFNDILAIKIHIYLTNDNLAAFYIFDLLFKNNQWVYNYERIGDDIGVYFKMDNASNIGSLQFINNTGGPVIARVKEYKILKSFLTIKLNNNSTNKIIPEVNITSEYFQLYIYVEKASLNQYAFYTMEGFLHHNEYWYTKTSFIGDNLNITFSINIDGHLEYTNPDQVNLTIIKIIINLPNQNIPLPPVSGGTGNTYLQPYSVLIGNGVDPIINTTEFIYKDCALQMLCKDSQIIVYNTTDATGLGTGGTLTLHGGASINKSLYVGNQLYVNNINMTPSPGDLSEQIFYANNNQYIADVIPAFHFNKNIVKSFIAQISITITLATNELESLMTLKGINTVNKWILYSEFIGDNTGITFSCDINGYIYYTSTDMNNWISSKIRFRATTTSV